MQEPVHFEYKGHDYVIGPLNAFKSLHITRKLTPLMVPLFPIFANTGRSDITNDEVGKLLQPLADGLAEADDATVEYIIGNCLSCVKRVVKTPSGTTQADIWEGTQGQFMFADLDMSDGIVLTRRVIEARLGPFIRGLLSQFPKTGDTDSGPDSNAT